MGELLSTVIPLSLGAMVSPTVLAVTILILGLQTKPRLRALSMVLGMAIVLVLVGLVAGSLTRLVENTRNKPLLDWLDILLGILLLGLAARKLIAKPKDSGQKSRFAGIDGYRLWGFWSLGLIVMLTDATSLVLFIPAIRDIARSGIPTAEKTVVAIIPFLAVLAPALLPLIATLLAPRTAGKTLHSLNDWVGRHMRAVSVSVCLIFGVYLLWHGGVRLLG